MYIGRTAQLVNLIEKPELNGSYVLVESFDCERERYGVRTLVPPTAANAAALSLAIELTSLQFCIGGIFAERFPAASVVQASMYSNDIIPGTILDFSQSRSVPVSFMEQVDFVFDKSCLCRGTPCCLSNTGEALPVTVIRRDVGVHVADDDGIIEFEDINFDNVLDNGFLISQAKQVVFRRCRFKQPSIGVVVGNNEPCCCTFESCLFEGIPGGDLFVTDNAHVTMINCVLRGPQLCVQILEGGRFAATHCTFYGAIQALGKVPSVELTNCTIIASPSHGIVMGNGSKARIKGCRITRCLGGGIVVKGPKRSTAHIEDCIVTECNMGFLLELGKIDVTLLNCEAVNNTYHGLHLGYTINGSVTVNNCTFRDNRGAMDVVKMCGPECAVTIDGLLQPPRCDADTMSRITADMKRLVATDIVQHGMCRVSLQKRRATKKTHDDRFPGLLLDLSCLNCKKPEPKEVKFKACGKCNEEVYCSRECQVAHWTEHKKECGKVEYA